jgi:hypothetical protein
MARQGNLLLNPLVHYGVPTINAVIILAIAFTFVEAGMTRNVMLFIAVIEVVAAPVVMKRAGRQTA